MAESVRETSRDYSRPYRPFPLGPVNRIGGALKKLGIYRKLDPESLIRSAAGKAGIPGSSNFLASAAAGRNESEANTLSAVMLPESIREAVNILVDSIEDEAGLNSIGRMITRQRLINVLRARFRAEALLHSQPEILNQTLAAPVIITGLQRTGTTLLHRLLAADRRFRSLSSWEVLDPVPSGSGEPKSDARIRSARMAQKAAAWMAPDFFAVHPINYMAPEEDVLLLDLSFRSTVAEAILRVPTYSSWLENVDSTEAYAFMRQLLLILQCQDSRPFWVLKTPHHLEYLDVLFKVFPEARVIQTHRDPAVATGSFLSMTAHGHGMFTDSPDPLEIGGHWMRKCRRMVKQGMAYRESLPAETEQKRFLDLSYYELIANPLAALETIYTFIGINLDTRAEEDARAYLVQNKRHRFGKHRYSLADFGFAPASVRRDFHDYRERYSIPDED